MKHYKIAAVIIVLCIFQISSITINALSLIGNDDKPYNGSGTQESPYVYLINDECKVTWKHFNEIRDAGTYEIYEKRENDDTSGAIKYKWFFDPKYLLEAEGPYFLMINFYEGDIIKGLPGGDNAFYFSFANKRDFPGKATVTMNVKDKFSDSQKLYLYYYGGYDSTIVHGNSPVIMPEEIQDCGTELTETAEELSVSDGYVTFDIRNGGNYFLSNSRITELNFDYSGKNIQQEVVHYDAEQVLGTVEMLFPSAQIADTIASSIGRNKSDTIKQGDLDSIKKLYIGEGELSNTSELEKLNFSKIESLTITGNKLESLGYFSMPMLNYLDLSFNNLKSVNNIIKYSTLKTLDLKNNFLTGLPELDTLNELQSLNISGNMLDVIMDIKNDSLMYIDASNNSITRVGNLDGCLNLKEINLSGQHFEKTADYKSGTDFKVDPAPYIISQYGTRGTVEIAKLNGKEIKEYSYDELVKNQFIIDSSYLKSNCKVTITGYSDDELLGTYVYNLHSNSMTLTKKIIVIIAVFMVLIIIMVIHKKIKRTD